MAWHRSLWFLVYQSLICHVLINHRIILVLVTGGRDYIQPSRRQYVLGIQAVYIYIYCQFDGSYMLPIPFYNLKKSVWSKLCKKKHSKRYELRRVSKCGRCLILGKNMKKAHNFRGSQTWLFLEYKPSEVFHNCFNGACTICKFV